MATYIVRVDPKIPDLYVIWSTVVDGPTTWPMTAQEIEDEYGTIFAQTDRFKRANATGTSARDGDMGWNDYFLYQSHHEGYFEVERKNFYRWIIAMEQNPQHDDEPSVRQYMRPVLGADE